MPPLRRSFTDETVARSGPSGHTMTTKSHIGPSALLAAAMLAIGGQAAAQDADTASGIADEITDEIVVRGVFIPNEKKSTSEITSVLSAEAFARAGDSDLASALSRVTGLSIADGRFPIVRGLNERYQSATLNGVPLPSPEPLRRAAPLDLFPTAILSELVVAKTFSPSYSGEFGGGLISLRTGAVPDEDFATLSVGFSVDTVTTLGDGLFFDGGDTDVLGFDDGLRDLPAAAEAAALAGGVLSTEAQTALDTSFDQNQTLLITSNETPVSGGGSLAFGKVFKDDGDVRIGTLFYAGYDNDFETRDGVRDRPERFSAGAIVQDPAEPDVRFDFFETRQVVELNALNTTGIEFGAGDHEVSLTSFLLRSTLKRAQISNGVDFDVEGGSPLRFERTDFIERQVWQSQLNGKHLFADLADLEVSWRAAYGEAQRDAPYERQTGFSNRNGEGFRFSNTQPDFNFINFSNLSDENLYGGIDAVLPIDIAGRAVELSGGIAYAERTRQNVRRDFSLRLGDVPDELAFSRADLIFDEAVLATSLLDFQVAAGRLFPDATEASLETFGAYGAFDVEAGEFFRFSGGLRYEDSTQESRVLLTSDPDAGQSQVLEDDFLLPALTVTWIPTGDVQLRAGWSQTLTRPQFRELAPTGFIDPDLDVSLEGNPFLVNTRIDSFDARAEWYIGAREFVTLGAFYKDFENPIEQFLLGTDAARASFLNAPGAEVWGAEAEAEKTFELEGIDGGLSFLDGKDLVIGANYTYAQSDVSADGEVVLSTGGLTPQPLIQDASGRITEGRPLQGQSDHLVNFRIGIEDPDTDSKVTLLVNYASERVLFAESPVSNGNVRPAVLEQPPLSVDLVVASNFELKGAEYGLGVKVTNLLGDDFEATQRGANGVVTPFQVFDRGTELSISLSRDF